MTDNITCNISIIDIFRQSVFFFYTHKKSKKEQRTKKDNRFSYKNQKEKKRIENERNENFLLFFFRHSSETSRKIRFFLVVKQGKIKQKKKEVDWILNEVKLVFYRDVKKKKRLLLFFFLSIFSCFIFISKGNRLRIQGLARERGYNIYLHLDLLVLV